MKTTHVQEPSKIIYSGVGGRGVGGAGGLTKQTILGHALFTVGKRPYANRECQFYQ